MNRRTTTVVLAAAYLFTLAVSALFLARDSVPPRWDAAAHLLAALDYRGLLREGHALQFLWRHYAYYPPLVYQITAALQAAFGPSPLLAWAVQEAFALLLLVATYRLGRTVGGRAAAALAAVCVLLLPIVGVFTREFALDVPLLAVATLFFALVRAEPFAGGRRAARLGAVIGLGLLTKWSFAIVAVVPLVEAVVRALAFAPRRAAALRRMALAAALALALAGPWYGTHLRRLWRDAQINAVEVAPAEGDPPVASLASLAFYPRMAADEWLYLPLGLAVAAAVAFTLRRGGPARRLLNATVWPVWLLFTLVPNKDPRYGLPLVPVLMVVLGDAVGHLRARRARLGAAAVLVGALALQQGGAVAGLGLLSARVNLCLPELRPRVWDPADPDLYFVLRGPWSGSCRSEWTLWNPYSYFGRRPRHEDWRLEPIVAALPPLARVWVGPPTDVHLNPILLCYAARRAGAVVQWVPTPGEATAWVWTGTRPPAALGAIDVRGCPRFGRPDGTTVTVCAAGR